MSGQQIGTVIGGIVGGFFFGNVALGMAIGGYLGGLVDPTVIKGPKIGDGQTQTSTDGSPIAWVQGTAQVAGTIVQVSQRRQIRHKDSGKGGGTVQETFTAQQDFAILICESCELRDSTMAVVWMVYQDGKLVYDVRPESQILSDSYKWAANVDFLYGGEDQMPHPTLEAITGVGNTPAYRGSCVAVFKNFDVSSAGNRIPTFHFVVSSSGVSPVSTDYTDMYSYHVDETSAEDYSAANFDFSAWPVGQGAFGNTTHSGIPMHTFVPTGLPGRTIWLRKTIPLPASGTLTIETATDDGSWIWINGVNYQNGLVGGGPITVGIESLKSPIAYIAVKAVDCEPTGTPTGIFNAVKITTSGTSTGIPAGEVPLHDVISRICKRGGLSDTDFDLTDLPDINVSGYMVAAQSNAADCLSPLLQAFFCFASDYNAKVNFHPYGEDATITISNDNLIEGDNQEGAAFTRTLRSQETEFPLRFIAQYYDPVQNYKPVQVTARRRASTVKAIGDQQFQIPVAISAEQATQAVDKAMKVAYATLQGTLEFTTPFADSDCYLTLPVGFPLIFEGKRYVIDQSTISQGAIDFKMRYDRQSAYTSNVQPILGNPPTLPASRYSGPTKLLVMNLPAQRPQDSVGVYLAAGSKTGSNSWLGCDVLVSYDLEETWQKATQIVMESNLGTFTANQPGGSGEPLSVAVLKFGLDSATPAQLAANANAFAVVLSDGTTQMGQFATATETSANHFNLTDVTRNLGGVPSSPIVSGQDFTLMDAAYFFPLDPTWIGRTISFKAVGFGENADDADVVTITYTALTAVPGKPLLTETGDFFTAEDGLTNIFSES
jgi:hypothetical protein